MDNRKIEKVESYVKGIMNNEASHDFNHVDRVRNWALQIAVKEGFEDLEMVEVSALMHDIGLTKTDNRRLHGEIGAEMTAKFLRENNLFNTHEIDEICNAIRFHNKNREGEGELLKILRDADMMDLFGAIGIMRAFISKSSKMEYDFTNIKGKTWQMSASDFDDRFDRGIGVGNTIIDEINFQISCYDNLSTESAKELARPFVEFMKDYIKQLEMEILSGRNKTGSD